MKIKIIILQIIYYILRFCLKFIFHTRHDVGVERVFYIQSDTEVMLEILFLLGLSFGMCRYILKSDKMIYTSLWMGLFLCFLFEISKYIEHLLGFLPHYGDVPMIISIFLSLVVILVYMCVLYVICLLWKKRKKLKN